MRDSQADRLALCVMALVTVLALMVCNLWNTQQKEIPGISPPGQQIALDDPPGRVGLKLVKQAGIIRANPARLLIPTIDLNAPIEPVGVLTNGSLATPARQPWTNVGWYSAGPRPGEPGSAVIDGHLDRPGGDPAVFWRLRELHPGDHVLILDVQGRTVSFHVTRVSLYPVQQTPGQAIFGNRQGWHLNLITCAGDWMPEQHQTTMRLVVYTTLDA